MDENIDISEVEPSPPAPSTRQPQAANRFSAWKAIQTILSLAFVMATLFTLWTPANLFSNQLLENMMRVFQGPQAEGTAYPTLTPAPRPRIGIVSGHMGNDSGAVCPDGLTEKDVNYKIASLVQKSLKEDGYEVDLLEEFDTRLTAYTALALVSIHNDSCNFINNDATGFKVAPSESTIFPEKADRLASCLIDRYAAATGLKFHANSITTDMTQYHAFTEINSSTPAVIIETGFLNLDRDILVNQTNKVAEGIRNGVLCYIRNEPLSQLEQPTP
jgi:N-acetylmuramoyl-L-alanine amidase